jgi:hypothetical protein
MNQFLLGISLLITLLSFQNVKKPYFAGEIIYEYGFTDANGNDISKNFAALIGKGQHYYINEKNYKALDEHGNLIELYNSDSNTYYRVLNDKSLKKIDASISTSTIFIVKRLKIKEQVAGYVCNAIEVTTDEATTTYFYSDSIKISPIVYRKHNYGEWKKILTATNGCLPLKFQMINNKQGFIVWTSIATVISKQPLSNSSFKISNTSKN